MRRAMIFLLALVFLVGTVSLASAENQLEKNEAELYQKFQNKIPDENWVSAKELHEEWKKRMNGESDAYLIDVRTDKEFQAFHIEGTDHVQAGHWYTIPGTIEDPNAEIYVWCRTKHRGSYVGGFLYDIGYKNVKVVDGGVLAWAKQGYPFVNQFTGNFKITKYRKTPSDFETQGFKRRIWMDSYVK